MDCKTVVGFILQMVEVMEGSGVYWYSHQWAYCSAFKSWPGYINASIDMFFNKDTLAASCAMGNEKKSNGHLPLNQVIIQELIGKLHCILKWHKLLKRNVCSYKHTCSNKLKYASSFTNYCLTLDIFLWRANLNKH